MPVRSEFVPARPPAALTGHVRRYLGYREYGETPVRRRQAPVGSCALIIGFGHRIRLGGGFGTVDAESFVAGISDAHVLTEFRGEQHGMQVDLTPLGLYTLLGHPMSALTNLVPTLDELGDPGLAALPARLAGLPGWPARFAHVSDVLARRLLDERARVPDPEVRHAWNRLRGTGGTAGVAQLATETGWSRRHLLTRFRDQVGLAPKATGRVLRFERACGLVTAGSGSLADVAALCGYSDQPHLVREFRALAGVTPTGYRTEWSVTATPPEAGPG
ncbi:AraC family transcriptional regulator [Pseudonocardia sp. KRD291]|uniref:helix-turn-helix domain-containing protein n=1 Tax=Pseudonocardia sp. KRD291 TaxID=2792007 RepID=UPI001C4A05CA|nr:AraC family transcriptional regulator [Pseudonocardia sp. KRD291]MBW0104028.1 helix-turn-helix transcriptional regulator [Pseudonocardia sp. KRD291]